MGEISKVSHGISPSFYKRILNEWPHLANLDIRHCTLVKLQMSNKEASEILGISPKSVQMARYRLKKKMNFDLEVSLKLFLGGM